MFAAVTSVTDLLKASLAPGHANHGVAVPNDELNWQSYERLLEGLDDKQICVALRDDGLMLFRFDTHSEADQFRKKIRPLRSFVYGGP